MSNPAPNPAPRTTGTPRWVKIFGLVAIVLGVTFVILHLTCGGLRGH